MAKATINPSQGKPVPVFNPSLSYGWKPDDIFEITGQQLASLYHCLTREINLPEGAPIALKYEAFQTVIDVFKVGVEQGVIIEKDVQPAASEVDTAVNSLFNNPKS